MPQIDNKYVPVREMTDEQFFRYYTPDKKWDPAFASKIDAEYEAMEADEQMDFILRMIKYRVKGLEALTLNQMKDMLETDQYGGKKLWGETCLYMKASQIKEYLWALGTALFGDFLLDEQIINETGNKPVAIDEEDVINAMSTIDYAMQTLRNGDYINYKMVGMVVIPEAKPEQKDPVKNEANAASKSASKSEQAQKPEEKSTPKSQRAFALEKKIDPKTGLVMYNGKLQPIGKTLTEDVINTGNIKVLKDFRKKNKKDLNKRERLYLDTRIETADKLEKLKDKAIRKIAWGEPPEIWSKEPDLTDGFTGFSNLKLDNQQTSDNGCWSCAYSLLLKSRGIFLTQEEIRAFRPDYTEDQLKTIKVSDDRKEVMNSDTFNNVYENADLLMKVCPNTTMSQVVLNPMSEVGIFLKTGNDEKVLDDDQKRLFKDIYIEQMTAKLKKVIKDAIVNDKSPIAVSNGEHYVTITGINEQGMLRIEDSAKSRADQSTRLISLSELVEHSIFGHNDDGRFVRGKGLSLTWLKDIPALNYDPERKENVDLHTKDPGIVKLNPDGNVSVEIPHDHPTIIGAGKPQTGQLAGQGISEQLTFDQTEAEQIFGGKLNSFGGNELYIGNHDEYFPNKVLYLNDPSLKKYAFSDGAERRFEITRNYLTSAFNNLHSNRNAPFELELLQPYIDALKSLNNEAYKNVFKEENIQEDVEKLRTLRDFFRNVTEDNKTYYQVLEEALGFKSRKEFRKHLLELDRLLNLGLQLEELTDYKSQAEIDFEEGRDAARDITDAEDGAFNWYISQRFNDLKNSTLNDKEEAYLNLAKILAVEEIRMEEFENYKQGQYLPRLSIDKVHQRAEKILYSKAFQNALSGEKYRELALGGDSVALVNAVNQACAELGPHSDDSIKEYGYYSNHTETNSNHMSNIVNALERTETGYYDLIGLFSRRRNSDSYNTALNAVRNAYQHRFNCNAANNYMYVEDIKAYLEGKEEVRTRSFAKTRFRMFMEALSEMMPRKEFEEYCEHINKVRDVGPNSGDYVQVENFLSKNATLGSVMKDTLEHINEDNYTDRDLARLIALRQISAGNETGEGEFRANKEGFGRTNLRNKTERILNDKDFKLFLQIANKNDIKQMLTVPNAAGLNFRGFLAQKEDMLRQTAQMMIFKDNARKRNTLTLSSACTGQAINSLLAYSNQERLRANDQADIRRLFALTVLNDILEKETNNPNPQERKMTNRIGMSMDRLNQCAIQIASSPEFEQALKNVKMDKPDQKLIRTYLLGDGVKALSEEFRKQMVPAANAEAGKNQPSLEIKRPVKSEVKKDIKSEPKGDLNKNLLFEEKKVISKNK